MSARLWLSTAVAASFLLVSGCGKPTPAESHAHDHAAHAEEEHHEEEGVAFEEGRGLRLPPEVVHALQLRTAVAELRPLAAEQTVTAQVFATAPRVLASARLAVGVVAVLEKAAFTGAKLLQIDRTTAAATGLVDLVFELDAATPPQPGDFVTLAVAVETAQVLTIPRSALLESATGTFAYVLRDGAYLRTAVHAGARSAEFVEITGGLRAGEVVVTTPVDQLWLAELRLTKGGGHSH